MVREAALFAALGMLPDVDLLFGMHSGPTHSIGATALVSLVTWGFARALGSRHPLKMAVACAAAYASHVLLDWLGTDASPPLGIMALWPFSREYYESELHAFMAISRRYSQGWTFVWQNVRAVALEIVLLAPVLSLVWLFRRRRLWLSSVVTALAIVASPRAAEAQSAIRVPPSPQSVDAHLPAHDVVVGRYRSGAIEAALDELDALLAASTGQRQISRWIDQAHAENRRKDLEAALLLYTDALMRVWRPDDPYPERLAMRYTGPFRQLHLALKDMNGKTAFLRAWYLLWESFRHVQFNHPLPRELDYLDEALVAFPNDSEILLAAGSREELNWSMSLENAQRDPDVQPFGITKFLMAARDLLRRSLVADARESEARLRLAHVLLELNELKSVPDVLMNHDWTPDGLVFEYLARLFEGDFHERSGNRKAAAAAYERASALAIVPQSALLAEAHVAHLDGRRDDAARLTVDAFSASRVESDPWWIFVRGLAWRFDAYVKAAHAMVMQ